MGRDLKISVVPQTVPTTASPYHPSATHVDVLGMPVAGVDGFPFHPTPCCGAAASISDGPMYCKGCYAEVDDAFGNVPVRPFTPISAGASRDETEAARLWDSERRDSPYSTVADVEDEFCDACGDAHDCDDCRGGATS